MENNWEHEIKARNLERVLSIAFQLTDFSKAMEADFEKAVDSDIVEKTGREIKQNLQAELTTVSEAKQVLLGRMTKLVKSIGQDPNGKADRQIMKGFENQIGDVPKQYEYGQIYIDNTVEKAGQMREFNKAAGDYIRRNIEELKLKTTIDNLPDDRVVKLSKALAGQLGFNDDEFEKGGEGSRGGKIIGHTKSGKPVYSHFGPFAHEYRDFTVDEHKEAADIHKKQAERYADSSHEDSWDPLLAQHHRVKSAGHLRSGKDAVDEQTWRNEAQKKTDDRVKREREDTDNEKG